MVVTGGRGDRLSFDRTDWSFHMVLDFRSRKSMPFLGLCLIGLLISFWLEWVTWPAPFQEVEKNDLHP